MLCRRGQRSGYETMLFDSGAKALDVLDEHADNLALVISDYHMGDMNGLEFRSEMQKKHSNIPFIIYSGFVVTKDILKYRKICSLQISLINLFEVSKLPDLIKEETKESS